VTLRIRRRGGGIDSVPLTLPVDTPIETEYLRHGGMLAFVLREIPARAA